MLFISNNMVSKNKMECSLNILIEYDVLSLFSWFMIRWQKKRANKFARGICDVFVSYWLEFLIHIHSNLTVFAHFKLFVDEWGPILLLKEEDTLCCKG